MNYIASKYVGIFFVNTPQKEQARNRVPVLFGGATLTSNRALPSAGGHKTELPAANDVLRNDVGLRPMMLRFAQTEFFPLMSCKIPKTVL